MSFALLNQYFAQRRSREVLAGRSKALALGCTITLMQSFKNIFFKQKFKSKCQKIYLLSTPT